MEEAVCWVAGKGDEEDEDDAVDNAKDDGSPHPVHKSDGERSSDSSVEA